MPDTVPTLEEVKIVTPEQVGDIVVTPSEIAATPLKVQETLLTLDEVRAIPQEELPIIMYCDGGSLFGWLIKATDKSWGEHLQLLYKPDKIATQWFWYRTVNVEHMKSYNVKLIGNRDWTSAQRKVMVDAIEERLVLGRWSTRYDVWGVMGEALHKLFPKYSFEWFQKKAIDFCSEAVARVIRRADPTLEEFLSTCPSPTPREYNLYTKSHNPPYFVRGRYFVMDDEG